MPSAMPIYLRRAFGAGVDTRTPYVRITALCKAQCIAPAARNFHDRHAVQQHVVPGIGSTRYLAILLLRPSEHVAEVQTPTRTPTK